MFELMARWCVGSDLTSNHQVAGDPVQPEVNDTPRVTRTPLVAPSPLLRGYYHGSCLHMLNIQVWNRSRSAGLTKLVWDTSKTHHNRSAVTVLIGLAYSKKNIYIRPRVWSSPNYDRGMT